MLHTTAGTPANSAVAVLDSDRKPVDEPRTSLVRLVVAPPAHSVGTSSTAVCASNDISWLGSLSRGRRPWPLLAQPSHVEVWGWEGGRHLLYIRGLKEVILRPTTYLGASPRVG